MVMQTSEPTLDPTVQRVLDTWAPRMIVQGIDYNDFVATQARISLWDDWAREWCKTAAMHEALAQQHEAEGNQVSAGEAYFRAAIAYHFAICNFVHDQEQYQAGHRRKVETYKKAAPRLIPPAERHEVPFRAFTMPGYLRLPLPALRRGDGPPPVVVIVSGVDSVKEEHKTMEDGFLQRGLATFSFDGPGQGETWQHTGMLVEYEQATSAVVDYLEQLPSVDAGRLGVFGPSMGGYLAPRSAAHEPRIKACAISGGSYDREMLARATESGDEFQAGRMMHLYKADRQTAVARLRASTLAGVAQNIRCPLLICHGTKDMVPLESTERLAREASGPVQRIVYEGGNHVNNNLPYRYRPAVWDFMAKHLL